MDNTRNLFLTIALSIIILTGWQVLYINPKIEAERQAQSVEQQRVAEQQATVESGAESAAIPAPNANELETPTSNRDGAVSANDAANLAETPRITIETPDLAGSINLMGGRLDDLILKQYRVTVNPSSDNITLLHPATDANGYFAELGYSAPEATGTVPGPTTIWEAPEGAVLTDTSPVTLTFTNENGLTFNRTIAVDDHSMFTFTDTISNASGAALSLNAYGRVTRYEKPTTPAIFVLHEGMIGVTGEEGLQEIDYDDVESERELKPGKSSDGWLGITDKYWAAVMVPPVGQSFQPRYSFFDGNRSRYQVDYLTDPMIVAPGASSELTTHIFAGAKQVSEIDIYEETLNIRQFDLLIDWGWFYFMTKPMFYLMDWLYKVIGNFGVAILLTTVIVKLIFFPLANKSYVSMARMKLMQPKMTELREKHGEDKAKLQQAMMELYKKEKINPIAGCWPVLIQIPVFFSLYKVLYVTIEMRHAPFFGWIRDLAAPDPTSLFNLFGLIPIDLPQVLTIGVWPLIMGVTMFVQMQMNPAPPDPTQAMIFKWMPVVFTFMLAAFPAGLVIYWAWNNFLSIMQQGFIMKRQGAKIELWDNLRGMFKKKAKDAPSKPKK